MPDPNTQAEMNRLRQGLSHIQREIFAGRMTQQQAGPTAQKIQGRLSMLQKQQDAEQQKAMDKQNQLLQKQAAQQQAIKRIHDIDNAKNYEKRVAVVKDHRTGEDHHIDFDHKGDARLAPWEQRYDDRAADQKTDLDLGQSDSAERGKEAHKLRQELLKHQSGMAKKKQAFEDKQKKDLETKHKELKAAALHFPIYGKTGEKDEKGKPIEEVTGYDMKKAQAFIDDAERQEHPENFREVIKQDESAPMSPDVSTEGQKVRSGGASKRYERIQGPAKSFQHDQADLEHEQYLKDQLSKAEQGRSGLSAEAKSKLLLHFMDKEMQKDAQEAREAGRMARDHPRTIQDAILRRKLGLPMGGGQPGQMPGQQQQSQGDLRRIGQGVQLRWDPVAGKEIREVPTTQGWMPEEEFNAATGPKPKKSVQERAADALHAHLAAIGEGPQRPMAQQPPQDAGSGGDYGQQAQQAPAPPQPSGQMPPLPQESAQHIMPQQQVAPPPSQGPLPPPPPISGFAPQQSVTAPPLEGIPHQAIQAVREQAKQIEKARDDISGMEHEEFLKRKRKKERERAEPTGKLGGPSPEITRFATKEEVGE